MNFWGAMLAKGGWLRGAKSSAVPDFPSVLERLNARLDELENHLVRVAERGKVVYIGKGRLLVRCRHLDLIYIVEADDVLIVPRFAMDGEYEPEVTGFLLHNITPEHTCIDVGANFGYYTCLLARLAHRGKVLAFEADPRVFQFTRNNMFINWLESVITCCDMAVGETPGRMTLYRRITRSGNTSIGQLNRAELDWLGEADSQAFTVEATTIDEQARRLARPIDFVKIDVEGAELLVMRGARETTAANLRIKVVMEWSPWQLDRAGFAPAALLDEIESQGFKTWMLRADSAPQAVARDDLLHLRYGNLLLGRE